MWSCGVIMYHLITGKLPFKEATSEETLGAIKSKEVKYEDAIWKRFDPDAKNLVMGLLDRDVKRRIKAAEALRHPWIDKFVADEKQSEQIINSLRNLKNLQVLSTFQKAVLIYIASQFSDPKEEQKYSQIFKLIDKDKDGKVTQADLYESYLDIYKNKFKANTDSALAIEKSDFSKNGSIEYTGNSFEISA
eukprot:TRINITY_DN2909_c0_g3_i1.p2 TRINITY_DN2909_c0_g3~~TRINITY_DN2909_c0_g3_i1.p2  ORF type:complete len:191 (-),score=61.32 TRINITY_DN2909_c0_g3_i1:362-934(-)